MGVFYEPAIVPQPVAIVMQAAMAGSSFSLTERHYRLLKRAPSKCRNVAVLMFSNALTILPLII